jgi:hypothetical protein
MASTSLQLRLVCYIFLPETKPMHALSWAIISAIRIRAAANHPLAVESALDAGLSLTMMLCMQGSDLLRFRDPHTLRLLLQVRTLASCFHTSHKNMCVCRLDCQYYQCCADTSLFVRGHHRVPNPKHASYPGQWLCWASACTV